jgi:hypothetical protein
MAPWSAWNWRSVGSPGTSGSTDIAVIRTGGDNARDELHAKTLDEKRGRNWLPALPAALG